MNVLITGGTGFIGSNLVERLIARKYHVYILTRQPKKYPRTPFVTPISYQYPIHKLPKINAVINLAGESLFGYWTKKKKDTILQSRIHTTEKIVDLLKSLRTKPECFITGSAVGFYGMSDDKIFTEKTTESGKDFLANVTKEWEKVASIAEDLSIRTVYARFGVVLDKKQGALPLMALPIKYGLGGKLGNGEQWTSWIHIEDCINMLLFALDNKEINGPLNVTAPNPQRNKDFTKALATVLKRPAFITAPKNVLKLALGEMNQLILEGQYVLPQKALDHQFSFSFPHLDEALKDIYRKNR